MKLNEMDGPEVTRRGFLKGGSVAALATMFNGLELRAQTEAAPAVGKKPIGPPIKCGIIGLGLWGREIVSTLARLPQAEIAAICETYPTSLRRGGNIAPKAAALNDYRKILDNKEIQAVFIATPTHKHGEIVLAALQAGKHVYCEAPLAHTIEDARTIARAAQAAPKLYFQAGLQLRSDPQRHFMMPFIRAGALGQWVMVRSQWHKKQSWRQASPNPQREQELNWRLRNETSPGLLGELGIHQIDTATWFLNAFPVSVSAFGSIRGDWNDHRDVPDTVQAMFEFPGGVQFVYDCTMANSFDAEYEMYYGSQSAVMLRGNKAWLFKEVDAPLLGWEVYARKENFYKETGLVVMANATKLNAAGDNTAETPALPQTPLQYALENFLSNVAEISGGIEDFVASFNGPNSAALQQYLAGLTLQPHAGPREAFAATVLALKANEAVLSGRKILLREEWFELG